MTINLKFQNRAKQWLVEECLLVVLRPNIENGTSADREKFQRREKCNDDSKEFLTPILNASQALKIKKKT